MSLGTVFVLLAGALAMGPAVPGAVWPLAPPEVVTGFAPPDQRWEAGHRGVDLRGTAGQPVRAAQAGLVSYAGLLAGRGVVVVRTGDLRTTYQPVAATVRVGDRVSAGARLGVLQPFGSHCWPRACLHWGLLRGQTYLDPLALVGPRPVRLLPLGSPILSAPSTTPAPATHFHPPPTPTAAVYGTPPMPWDELGGRPAAAFRW